MRMIGRAAAVVAAALLLAAPAAAATTAAATTPAAATLAPASTTAAFARTPAAADRLAASMATTPVVYGFGNYGLGSLHASVMPDRIGFGTDGTHFITHLRWSRWQPAGARAVGRYHIDNCVPTCAGGRYHVYRVTVILSHVLTSDGQSYFSGMTLRWAQSGVTMTRALTWGRHGGTVAFWG